MRPTRRQERQHSRHSPEPGALHQAREQLASTVAAVRSLFESRNPAVVASEQGGAPRRTGLAPGGSRGNTGAKFGDEEPYNKVRAGKCVLRSQDLLPYH
jgi:hypothetical protein